MHKRRVISAALFSASLALAPVVSVEAAAKPKRGQFCKAADIGKKSGGLTCKRDAKGRARWQ